MIEEALDNGRIAAMIGATSALLVRPLLRSDFQCRFPGMTGPSIATRHQPVSAPLRSTCGVAAAISWLSVPHYARPMWSVLAILGVRWP